MDAILKARKEGRVYDFNISNPIPEFVKEQIVKLYEKKFKRTISKDEIESRIKDGDTYSVYIDKNHQVLAYVRWFKYYDILNSKKKEKTEKYLKLFGVEDLVFIDEIASDRPGLGRTLLELLEYNHPGMLIALVPVTDDLIPYYEKLGYSIIKPKEKKYPVIIMYKKGEER